MQSFNVQLAVHYPLCIRSLAAVFLTAIFILNDTLVYTLFLVVIDRYWFFITDTDYLYVYVPDNRYTEPIFIYCYKENK